MATASLPSKEALSKLDGILNCPICLDSYTDPRALPCLHTYCKKCIDNLPSVERGSRIVNCPECRRVCQLGREGADTLPKAFHVHNLQEIKESLKSSGNEPQPECQKHKKIKNLFCEQCEELMCLKCSHESHSDHLDAIDEAEDLFGKHVRQIEASLQPVDMKINEATRMLACFDETERNIKEKGEVVKNEIDQAIEQQLERLVATLRLSKQALLEDADAATRQKLELHSMERAELETILVRLTSCKDFVQEKLKLRSRCQIQAAKKELIQRIKDAHSEVKVSELQPGQSADIKYVKKRSINISPPDVGNVMSTLNYRSVHGLFSVDIPEFVVNGVSTEVFLITSVSLQLSVKLVHCNLKVRNLYFFGDETTSCKVEQVDEGRFRILLHPEHLGPHELSVCIGEVDAHIQGSPFEITVMSIAEWRGQRLKVFARDLRHPRGLAVTDDGKLLIVTEWHGHCLAVFSTVTGELLYRIGQRGTGLGEFVEPYEVEVSGDNHIFVKDNGSLQKFALDGSYEDKIGKLKYSNGMKILSNGDEVLTGAQLPHNTNDSIIKIRLKLLYMFWHRQGRDWIEISSPCDFAGEPYDIDVDTSIC